MNRRLLYFLFGTVLIVVCFVWLYKPEIPPEIIVPKIEKYHTAMYYYDNTDFFPASVASFTGVAPISPAPRIFIVNQHVLAAHLIARQFAQAADPKVKTVVLITQNNWNAGRAPIITSEYGWRTTLGTSSPASDIIQSLVSKKVAVVDEDIFAHEHGITGVVPYVAHSFPNARVVTLVIRDRTGDAQVDALASELAKLDLSETVIIGTIDMSHYLPKYIADIHDRLVVQSIKEFDYDTLPRLDIDTAPTLRSILKVAEYAGEKTFVQTGGINSADIIDDPELMLTTSYLTGYFKKGSQEIVNGEAHLLFVGDIMLDRAVAKSAREKGIDSLFANVERLFLGTHAVIGNLEGTITSSSSIAAKDSSILRFTFDPMYAGLLDRLGFSVLSLANNHALDFGKGGYAETKRQLENVGIVSFGSPINNGVLTGQIMVQGKSICFVGYHDLFTYDETPVTQEIARIRPTCDRVVLFAHWGEEYVPKATARQQKLAHAFIDAGADLIIGAHPHIVEPIEIYKNKAIFYSLGNFMFDQYFSYATTHGVAVHVEWGDERTRFTLIPVSVVDEEVKIAEPIDQRKILPTLIDENMPLDIRSAILEKNEFILWNNK
ncbi:MAG: AmmeMemoRadiSam system protein B [Minisyncoccia bacterium]